LNKMNIIQKKIHKLGNNTYINSEPD